MFTHFSGNGPKSEPRFKARHCSECGHELYADEDFICNTCVEDGLEEDKEDD